MQGVIYLNLNEEYDLKNSIEIYSNNFYLIDLYGNINQPFDKLIEDQTWLKDALKEKRLTYYDKEYLSLIDKLDKLSNDINLLSEIEYIKIDEEYIIEYLKYNPSLNNKKIVISEIQTFTKENVEIMKKYKKYNNIYISTFSNEEYISISDFIKTYEKIKIMSDQIKKYNLSSLEQVMYAYDLVRNRVYKEEDKGEKPTISRDLTSALLTNNIVCLGFANIFNTLLNELGISSDIDIIYYLNEKTAHARNVVYINDTKYKIEGVYYFDTTWDSKKNNDNYLDSYKYFAKTKSQMDELDKGSNNKYLYNIDDKFLNEFINYITDDNIIYNKSYSKLDANRISRLIIGKNLIDSQFICDVFRKENIDIKRKEIIERLKQYLALFNKKIDNKKLIKLLFNVRKIEYYEEPNKYKLSIDDIKKTVINSKWCMSEMERRFLKVILGKIVDIEEELNEIISEEDIDKKIAQVKLTKTLSKIKLKY